MNSGKCLCPITKLTRSREKRKRCYNKIWIHSWRRGKFKPKDKAAVGGHGVKYKAARFTLPLQESSEARGRRAAIQRVGTESSLSRSVSHF